MQSKELKKLNIKSNLKNHLRQRKQREVIKRRLANQEELEAPMATEVWEGAQTSNQTCSKHFQRE